MIKGTVLYVHCFCGGTHRLTISWNIDMEEDLVRNFDLDVETEMQQTLEKHAEEEWEKIPCSKEIDWEELPKSIENFEYEDGNETNKEVEEAATIDG